MVDIRKANTWFEFLGGRIPQDVIDNYLEIYPFQSVVDISVSVANDTRCLTLDIRMNNKERHLIDIPARVLVKSESQNYTNTMGRKVWDALNRQNQYFNFITRSLSVSDVETQPHQASNILIKHSRKLMFGG